MARVAEADKRFEVTRDEAQKDYMQAKLTSRRTINDWSQFQAIAERARNECQERADHLHAQHQAERVRAWARVYINDHEGTTP